MPNRILKESICGSETIDQLTQLEEVFFYRLLVNCDDFGRMDARAKILKAKLFPLKDNMTLKSIEDGLRVLATVGLVVLYKVDGKPFLQLPTWEAHQQVRAKKSKYPAPEINGNHLISDDCKCPRNPIQSESESNVVVKDARARGEEPPDSLVAFCQANFPAMNAAAFEQLGDFLGNGITDEMVRLAVNTTRANGSVAWGYAASIMDAWVTGNIKSREAAETSIAQFKAKKNAGRQTPEKPAQPQKGDIDRHGRVYDGYGHWDIQDEVKVESG
ncbi:MAG: DnaD domain protein [Coriobacteriia bacterium]|nr:DnaD domain protein [Coriobacteriia bacterium]